ncbi:MAG: hypothetical protein NVSMB12_07410 [Acidimicrobiales bacterium]
MHQFLSYSFSGLATSAIYALAAAGLVLTYTTTGTFNFAHGATGMVAAFAYWQLRFGWHWSAPVALLAVLFVLAPLFGALLDVVVMRRLDGTPESTRLVVTISVLVGLLGVALWIWKPDAPRPVRAFYQGHFLHVVGVRVPYDQAITLALAAFVAAGLRLLLYRSRIGIAMRATVDDRALTCLSGARPDRGSMLAWAIGAALAALSGILIAPTLNVSALPLTLLIVNAYAAAMIGRLRSLPMTFVGALILGMANELVPDYLRRAGISSRYLEGMYLSVPVIVLFVVLLVLPSTRLRGHSTARGREIVPMPRRGGSLVFTAVVIAGAAMVATVVGRADLENISRIFGIAMIGLSLVPLIGFAGQVSLCQLSFAGIGAVVMAHAGAGGNPLGLIAAAVVAGAVGAVVALPALRLSGIYLALATAAFAVTMDRWIFPFPPFSVLGHRFDLFQEGSLTIPRPRLLGLRFDGQRAEFVLMAIGFSACALVVVAIRRSTFGSRLLALKDSPAACATLGLNVTRTKLTVFALSASMAGFGGALYGGAVRVAAGSQFDFFTGLPILLVMVISGIGTVGGALACGILLGSPVLGNVLPGLPQLTLVLSGTAGIGMARNPNGFVLELRDRWAPLWGRPLRAAAVGALLVATWALRVGSVIGNWPYAIASIVVLGVAPALALSHSASEKDLGLEWAGLRRPFTAEDVAAMDRALALPEAVTRVA